MDGNERMGKNCIKTASNHTLFIDNDAYYEIFSDFHHYFYDFFSLHNNSAWALCGEKEETERV